MICIIKPPNGLKRKDQSSNIDKVEVQLGTDRGSSWEVVLKRR